ncbi:MAG: hypothetical protein FJ027_04395 [Candidatus Rokubacteria bacterium]|nr:hypothetical protein [Candidatus Rokubacteria bacterium]
MARYARFESEWWRNEGRRLRADRDARELAFYLRTCLHANMIGLYYVSIPTIAHELNLTPAAVVAALATLETHAVAVYDAETEYVWVVDMARAEIGESLRPRTSDKFDKRGPAILKLYRSTPSKRLASAFLERYGVAFELSDADAAPSMAQRSPSEGASEAHARGSEGPSCVNNAADGPSKGHRPASVPTVPTASEKKLSTGSQANEDRKDPRPIGAIIDIPPETPYHERVRLLRRAEGRDVTASVSAS